MTRLSARPKTRYWREHQEPPTPTHQSKLPRRQEATPSSIADCLGSLVKIASLTTPALSETPVYVNGRYTRIQRRRFRSRGARGFLLFRRSSSCYRLCAFCFSALLSSYPHAFRQALRKMASDL